MACSVVVSLLQSLPSLLISVSRQRWDDESTLLEMGWDWMFRQHECSRFSSFPRASEWVVEIFMSLLLLVCCRQFAQLLFFCQLFSLFHILLVCLVACLHYFLTMHCTSHRFTKRFFASGFLWCSGGLWVLHVYFTFAPLVVDNNMGRCAWRRRTIVDWSLDVCRDEDNGNLRENIAFEWQEIRWGLLSIDEVKWDYWEDNISK